MTTPLNIPAARAAAEAALVLTTDDPPSDFTFLLRELAHHVLALAGELETVQTLSRMQKVASIADATRMVELHNEVDSARMEADGLKHQLSELVADHGHRIAERDAAQVALEAAEREKQGLLDKCIRLLYQRDTAQAALETEQMAGRALIGTVNDTQAALAEAQAREAVLQELLGELYATVRGECPSLLDELSGGNSYLDGDIEQALAAPAGWPEWLRGLVEAVKGMRSVEDGGDGQPCWCHYDPRETGGHDPKCRRARAAWSAVPQSVKEAGK